MTTRRLIIGVGAVLLLAGIIGLLTPENVGEMMLVRSVRPDWRFRRPRTAAPGSLA